MRRLTSRLSLARAAATGTLAAGVAIVAAAATPPAFARDPGHAPPGPAPSSRPGPRPDVRTWARIDFFPHLGPTRIRSLHNVDMEPPEFDLRSPSYDAYAANAISAMLAGQPVKGGRIRNNPTAFEKLLCRRFRSGEMVAVPFDMWRGTISPTGAFANEKGTQFRLGVRITSNRPFTLSQVRKIYVDSLDSDDFDMAESIREFEADRAVGVHWGPNRRPGGGDDVVYDNALFDPATTPLNVFVWLGNPKFDYILQETLDEWFGGDAEAMLDDFRFWAAGGYEDFTPPLFFRYTYRLDAPGMRTEAHYQAQISDTLPRLCPQLDRR